MRLDRLVVFQDATIVVARFNGVARAPFAAQPRVRRGGEASRAASACTTENG